MANRYRLKAASMEIIRATALKQFGEAAEIVSAEKVTTGGLAGFFAQHHYEAIIKVPGTIVPRAQSIPSRDGILELLSNGDQACAGSVALDKFSTGDPQLAALLADLDGEGVGTDTSQQGSGQ